MAGRSNDGGSSDLEYCVLLLSTRGHANSGPGYVDCNPQAVCDESFSSRRYKARRAAIADW